MNKLIFGIVVLFALGAIFLYAFPGAAKVAGLDSRVDLSDSANEHADETSSNEKSGPISSPIVKITKTKEQWKALLTPMQYDVTRNHGTERAFTGEFWDNKKAKLSNAGGKL